MAEETTLEKAFEVAAEVLCEAKHVVVLTGAGISVESGIRPFRGPGGLWTERGEPPMDGFQRFMADPKKAWEDIVQRRTQYGDDFTRSFREAKPNPGHYALAELEELGIVKYLITQNVDNLHRAAGSKNVAEIHGNMALLRCLGCNARYPRDQITLETLPPRCPKCNGVIKSDGVMFGEPIPSDVLDICQRETARCDCILSVGTSAFVYPAAGFPQTVKRKGGALIEVNLYETPMTPMCDISLRGQSGEILPELVKYVKAKLKR